jgi:hypothetical protein
MDEERWGGYDSTRERGSKGKLFMGINPTCWNVFTGRVCLSLMERTTMMMENRKIISLGGEVNSMKRSKLRSGRAVQKCDQDQILDHGFALRVFTIVGSL